MPVETFKGGKRVKPARWRARRAAIIRQLGGKCAVCGTTENLEIDHREPLDWTPGKLSKTRRLAVYEKALRAGNLQLLCETHHGEKTRQDDFWRELNPF